MQNEPVVSFKSVKWGRLFTYLKPYRGRMALAVLALLISSGFGLAFPLVIVRLLTSVTQSKSFGPLNNLALLLGGIFLLQAAILLLSILPAGLRRGAHRLRPAHFLVRPFAKPVARLLRQPAGWRYRLAPVQRRDHDAYHVDQQPYHAA